MIKDMKHRDNLRTTAKHYGLDSQLNKTLEELSELSAAIERREFGGEHGIFEEMADVFNMLEQIAYLLNARQAVEDIAARKMQRQIERIGRERDVYSR